MFQIVLSSTKSTRNKKTKFSSTVIYQIIHFENWRFYNFLGSWPQNLLQINLIINICKKKSKSFHQSKCKIDRKKMV